MSEIGGFHQKRYNFVAGGIGLCGALLMFAGDMLLYGHFGSGSAFIEKYRDVIASASPARLYIAGLIGPVAASLYLIGVYHLYLQLRPAPKFIRALTAGSFAVMFVVAGAFHATWGAYAFVIQAAASTSTLSQELTNNIVSYMNKLYFLAEVPGYVGAILLFFLIALNKTCYPRWSILINPGLLMLLSPLASSIPAPLGAVIVGGFFNLTFAIFFTQSLLVGGLLHEKRFQDHGNDMAT